MTIQQLIYVVEIEKTRSFTWAADNLFMSQPNLSRSIRELEKSLGFEIFQRTSRGMVPTHEGTQLIERARRILFQIESINEIGSGKQQKRQMFGVSVPHVTYAALAMQQFIADLDPDLPIDIDYCETNTMQAIENVREQRHDLAIVRFKSGMEVDAREFFENHSIMADKVWESETYILISRQHPLAGCDCIDHNLLSDYIEVKYRDNTLPVLSATQLTTDDSSSKKQAVTYSYGSQFELLSGSSTAFMWSTPLPAEIIARENLVMRPCSLSGEKYTDMLLWRAGYTFSQTDEKFIDYVKNVVEKVNL